MSQRQLEGYTPVLPTGGFMDCQTLYTREEFLEVDQKVITGQLGKDPDRARYIDKRVVMRTTRPPGHQGGETLPQP